ncbi:MAG: UDP-3-O-(3-hydroxymyristoyl)glucosamine N-acyltransferase [Bdellovibrionales bacterium]|nr:UDP-3-O-(3-hydroxymyristoyl)glucosamine N-acyltransferase [Bdellovibrionales bacterium]
MDLREPIKISTLGEALGALLDDQSGNLDLEVTHFSTAELAQAGAFTFINDAKKWPLLEQSHCTCVLAPSALKEKVEKNDLGKTWLFSKNVDLAARDIKQKFFFQTPYQSHWQGIHPTAVVGEGSSIDDSATLGPHAVVGKNCKIGKGTFIGANACIEDDVTIGEHTTIHPLAYVGHHCLIGNHCEIKPNAVIGSEGFGYAHDHLGNHYRIPHTGRVILKDHVHIGAGSAVDRGTITDSIIGEGTKIDNHVHCGHNFVIGKNGLITGQVVVAGSTTIGDNFICGGHTAITGHIQVADNVQVAGFSGVAKSVERPGAYGGYPLQPVKDSLRTRQNLLHLTEMRRSIKKLMKKVFPEES